MNDIVVRYYFFELGDKKSLRVGWMDGIKMYVHAGSEGGVDESSVIVQRQQEKSADSFVQTRIFSV